MARILGVDIPDNKQLGTALTAIYGIGPTLAKQIVLNAKIDPLVRVRDLTEEDLAKVRKITSQQKIEGDLRRKITLDIKRLMEIGSYRGLRHRRKLPCRGQSTKSNARTVKGVRKTVANKKSAPK